MSSSSDFYRELKKQVSQWMESSEKRPFVVGLNAPQGAGKTTLTAALVEMFSQEGLNAVHLSVDDFYLTREEQIQLSKDWLQTKELQQRGYPGTHDVDFGVKTLEELLRLGEGELAKIPRYDKSAYKGKGDRRPPSDWGEIKGVVDLVLFEGWMLGFQAPRQSDDTLWKYVDEKLIEYNKWLQFFDAFIYLPAENHHFVLEWRTEAERKMRNEKGCGMTEQEVKEYAEMFLPAYERYSETVRGLTSKPFLKLVLGKNRVPIMR